VLSAIYITEFGGELTLRVCFEKVESDARPHQLIAITGRLRECSPIACRDLPAAAFGSLCRKFDRPEIGAGGLPENLGLHSF
jgi:hypothetical protein